MKSHISSSSLLSTCSSITSNDKSSENNVIYIIEDVKSSTIIKSIMSLAIPFFAYKIAMVTQLATVPFY